MENLVTALLPMRHTSERVRGKNMRTFRGRPLYHRIVETLLRVPSIGTIVIDTDSPMIKDDASKNFPQAKILDRPEHLRAGEIPMNDVLKNAISQLDGDHFLQTHSTNPLLKSATVENAIAQYFQSLPARDSLFGVTRLQTRLYDAAGLPLNHDPAVLLRTQDLPPVYEENSCIYLFPRAVLETTGLRIGKTPALFEIERREAVDIDEEIDFEIAEALARETEAR